MTSSEELRDAIEHVQYAVEFQDAINSEAIRVIIDAATRADGEAMSGPPDVDALIADLQDALSARLEVMKGGGALYGRSIDAIATLSSGLRQEAERADDLEERLSELLWNLTGGRMSHTGYDVRTMTLAVEEVHEREAQAEIRNHSNAYQGAAADLARAHEVIEKIGLLVEEHERIEKHNDTVPLNRLSDIQQEPRASAYRAILSAYDQKEKADG